MKTRMGRPILLTVLFMALLNLNSIAQTEFGIKAGPNLAKYSGTLIGADYKYKVGFFVGGYVNFGITEELKIQPEILFALHGSRFVTGDIEVREGPDELPVIGPFKTKTTETTVQIPIMAQYFVADRFYFEGGPQFGIILNRNEELIESPFNDPSFNQTMDFDPDTFDLGLAVGAGYELNETIALNVRYFFGLIERDLFEVKSSVLNLGIEYQL
ncbi:porin family protein [Luteirhabdus pelagi]|uniref:porin family protein n=1 Tax=Luteirhabdus pelagi TaxID=2792783 RepID=UPI001939DDD7|nr:porin family protein [Luteirhabdus pelagi]